MTWDNFKQQVEMAQGYAVVMLTDRFIVDRYPLSTENEQLLGAVFEQKLLDMRVFNESMEYRLFRTDAGKEFKFSSLPDEGREFFDDFHYLDIDEKRSEETFRRDGTVRATGGGYYRLPLEDYHNAKVIIRNYVDYDENSGQAYIKAWRLAGFKTDAGREV